jgi:antitoxin MazE2
MTMLSFRVDQRDAAEAQEWADRLGVGRSELLREALHRHLVALRGEWEAERYEQEPQRAAELSIAAIADWRPAEDWADWAQDAPR